MKKSAAILSCILLMALHGRCQTTSKALFLGNSYTYVNDLPALIKGLVQSGGDNFLYEQSTPGGHTFQMHTSNATSLNFLAMPGFDFLILQEQSQLPSFSQGQVQNQVYPYAEQLDNLFDASNPCGQTVFYMTWGRKFGDASNCVNWPPVCTYEGMQGQLRMSYLNMAQQNTAIVAPVGVAWWEAMLRDSTIELYNNDQSHPALTGSYLAACVFYGTMYRQTPLGLSYFGGLDSITATFLQQVADDVVFDSLAQWRIGLDDLSAAFSHTSTNALATFTDNSNNATAWAWDFGDGNTSTLQSPQHTYASSGTYTVTLTASNACDTTTTTDTVSILIVGNADPLHASMLLFPNPAHGSTQLQAILPAAGPLSLEIMDVQGVRVWSRQIEASQTRLDISLPLAGLSKGVYVFRCSGADWSAQQKLVVE